VEDVADRPSFSFSFSSFSSYLLLPLFQIITRFSISRFMDFDMYLDINCLYAQQKLEKPKHLIIWNVGNISK
jgi:hypothetical protein